MDAAFGSIVEDIARQLYNEKLKTGTISRELYEKTADRIMKSVLSGLDEKGPFSYEDPNNSLLAHLRQNVHAFSAAKSLTQLRQFNDMLVRPDGKLRSEAEFIAACAATGAEFNKNYLATERITALAKTQSAVAWNTYKDGDIIEILTVGDDKVRPAHALLDHFTAPKTDPVWLRLWPPFAWRCRCKTSHGLEKNIKPFKTSQLLKDAEVSTYFQSNSGRTQTVFDKGHPYYIDSFKKEKELAAERNYNMRSIDKVYQDTYKPAKVTETRADANHWWQKRSGSPKGNIDTVDALGNTLRFDNEFRVHVMEDNKDERFKLVSNIEDIVSDPDEVWSIRDGSKMITTYIRYYEDYPYCVQVDGVRPYTAFKYEKNGKLNVKSIEEDRRGILMYRND